MVPHVPSDGDGPEDSRGCFCREGSQQAMRPMTTSLDADKQNDTVHCRTPARAKSQLLTKRGAAIASACPPTIKCSGALPMYFWIDNERIGPTMQYTGERTPGDGAISPKEKTDGTHFSTKEIAAQCASSPVKHLARIECLSRRNKVQKTRTAQRRGKERTG
jgi:hypothetical protein